MRKLLSTDLDGTLLFNGNISDADLDAMARWRAAGHLLVPNTGRSVYALRTALEPSGLAFDHAVLYTGAALVDSSFDVVRATTLPEGLAEEVLDLLEGRPGVTVFATTLEGDLQLYDSIGSHTALLTLFTRAGRADLAGRSVVGVPLRVVDPDRMATVQAEVEHHWGGVAAGFRNQDFLDIVPAGASKGRGLTELVDLLTADSGPCAGEDLEVWSVGDSWNDIFMHLVADHAVAMEGSPVEVQDVCESTTPSVTALIDRILADDAG